MTTYFALLCLISIVLLLHQWILVPSQLRADAAYKLPYPKWMKEVTGIVFCASASYLLLTIFVLERSIIPSPSMLPNYHIKQTFNIHKLQYNLQNPITYDHLHQFNAPKTGQAVVARLPYSPNVKFIKRVWATGGDTFELSKQGMTINATFYPFEFVEPASFTYKDKDYAVDVVRMHYQGQDYLFYIDSSKAFEGQAKITIPENEHYLLGDNLSHSTDSRHFGTSHNYNLVGAPG